MHIFPQWTVNTNREGWVDIRCGQTLPGPLQNLRNVSTGSLMSSRDLLYFVIFPNLLASSIPAGFSESPSKLHSVYPEEHRTGRYEISADWCSEDIVIVFALDGVWRT